MSRIYQSLKAQSVIAAFTCDRGQFHLQVFRVSPLFLLLCAYYLKHYVYEDNIDQARA